jgi:Dehydrogenases with different specificities (related to short-chain alcohol dehydrogenases)
MDLQIDGDAALVTASSGGLGKAAAAALVAEGVDVVINGRDEQRLSAAATELAAIGGGEVIAQPGDLREPEDIQLLVERTVDAYGGIDHLVTSAGGPPSGAFTDIPTEAWYDTYDLLVMSVVRLVHAAAPYLEDGGGTIVTITSRSVKEAIDGLVLSNAVRMAVIGLEKTLSTELAPAVRANAVLPGPHETARIRELIDQQVDRGEVDSYEEGLAAWAEGVPVGHIGDADGLGATVAFLCSPHASYINGVAIPVDGGAGASNL